MKIMRTEFHYPAIPQSGPLSFNSARASCSIPGAAFPLVGAGGHNQPNPGTAPAYVGPLYWQTVAEQQQTEFLENIVFAALGASGLVGVAVSFL